MSHHLLAPSPVPRALAHLVAPARTPRAANDDHADAANDALLRTALRLFAAHGLGAARHAQERARDAFFAGESEAYRWWLAVTRTLDRKLAAELAGQMGSDLPVSRSLPQR